jgi:PiT family inorganic phosphate transporter
VVSTAKKGIIDPADIGNPDMFVWVMIGALPGAAIWLNIASWIGAPVSTTHTIVGGVIGAGIASSGWEIVNWNSMTLIASSWVISSAVGGLIAAATLFLSRRRFFFSRARLAACSALASCAKSPTKDEQSGRGRAPPP